MLHFLLKSGTILSIYFDLKNSLFQSPPKLSIQNVEISNLYTLFPMKNAFHVQLKYLRGSSLLIFLICLLVVFYTERNGNVTFFSEMTQMIHKYSITLNLFNWITTSMSLYKRNALIKTENKQKSKSVHIDIHWNFLQL